MRNMEKRHDWIHVNHRRRMIKFFYGITVVQFDEQMIRQNGGCAFCGYVPPVGVYLSVDHAHGQHEHAGTKRGCPECIRGLLCNNCNRSVLPVLEKNEHLQNDLIKAYLAGRPFLLLDGAIGSTPLSESGNDGSSPSLASNLFHSRGAFNRHDC